MKLPRSIMMSLNAEEEKKKDDLISLEREIRRCNDVDDLFDLYCKADDIWLQYFEVKECSCNFGSSNYVPDHEKFFLERQEKLENEPETVTFNIYGCNVTFVNHR